MTALCITPSLEASFRKLCRWWWWLPACLRSFQLHCPGCKGRRLADALPPFCSLADTLPPFGRGGCFAAGFVLLFRRMLCRLVGRVDALPPLVVLATFASYGL